MLKISSLLLALFIFSLPQAGRAYASDPLRDLVIGESLEFIVRWNGISVGTVSTTVEELTEIQGREAYKVVIRATTNEWASLIYKVDDRYITYIDYETSGSLRHEVDRSEGRYRKKAVIDYIYGRFLAEYHYLKSGNKKSVDVEGVVHDPVSALYYFLRCELTPGKKIALNIDLNEKKYHLFVGIENGHAIRLPRLGRFDTVMARPYLERKGKPYNRGNGLGYISNGEDRLPVFAVASVFPWGRFSATLLSRSPSY
ncbi:MAG: DUF3108 domain-containing protein [Candidatus Omnitrophota bacterium]